MSSGLLVDKHRPKTLGALTLNPGLSPMLERLGARRDYPHLLLHGPPGSGKKTRVLALLRAVYGPGVDRVKVEQRRFTVQGRSKPIELTTLASNYHVELNPSDAGSGDRAVVQEMIKELATSAPLDINVAFKTIVLTEVDSLSRQVGCRKLFAFFDECSRVGATV